LGVATQMVVYPGEGHMIADSRGGVTCLIDTQ